MNQDQLTLSPETTADKLSDCKVGEEKELYVKGTVTSMDDNGLTLKIEDVQYDSDEDAGETGEDEGAEESGGGGMGAMNMGSGGGGYGAPPKKKGPSAAVIAILGKKK